MCMASLTQWGGKAVLFLPREKVKHSASMPLLRFKNLFLSVSSDSSSWHTEGPVMNRTGQDTIAVALCPLTTAELSHIGKGCEEKRLLDSIYGHFLLKPLCACVSWCMHVCKVGKKPS